MNGLVLSINLKCPVFASYMDIYTPSDTQLSPHYLPYSKVYVDMENFLFCLCDLFVKKEDASYTRDLFTEKVLSRWDNFNVILSYTRPGGQKVVECVYGF